MNDFPGRIEIQEIAKQRNIDDFDFFMTLWVSGFLLCLADILKFVPFQNWFFFRYMADEEVAQRQYEATKAAA